MSIEVRCPSCHQKLRVPDQYGGKKAKCPKCHGVIDISSPDAPAAEPHLTPKFEVPSPVKTSASAVPVAPKQTATKSDAARSASRTSDAGADSKEDWYLRTEEGEQYGPVSKHELDSWMSDGRVDASCQLLHEGWEHWKWAEEVYPGLAEFAPSPAPPAPEPELPTIHVSPSPRLEVNPFASPTDVPAISVHDGHGDATGITPATTLALAQTRPWVLFLSILGFLVGGIVVLAAMGMAASAVIGQGSQTVPMLAIGLVYLIIAAIYLLVSYYLFTYASRIKSFVYSRSAFDLERAIVAQKSFWKLMGIFVVVGIVFYVLAIVAVIVGVSFVG